MPIKQELDCIRWEGESHKGLCSGLLLGWAAPRHGTLASGRTLLSPCASWLGRSLGDSVSLDFV